MVITSVPRDITVLHHVLWLYTASRYVCSLNNNLYELCKAPKQMSIFFLWLSFHYDPYDRNTQKQSPFEEEKIKWGRFKNNFPVFNGLIPLFIGIVNLYRTITITLPYLRQLIL